MSFDTLITLLIISHKGHHGKDDQAGNGNVEKANEDR
jgi:hypothetical protein